MHLDLERDLQVKSPVLKQRVVTVFCHLLGRTMACFALVTLLSIFCILAQTTESPNRRESSSTINKSLTSDREEDSNS